ncbi:MAG TPA: hypothetical protein VG500_01670 [Gemmatimonadales bacterium]|nr:hypothetical protein [Gemmatimonadales bacterium]
MRSYVVLSCALVVFLAACGEDAPSPTAPDTGSTPAAGDLRAAGWYQVSAGNSHTCGVTTDNRAWCWGFALLGDGSPYSQRLAPTAVAGGHEFREVSAGVDHTCGVTTDRRAWCWGGNSTGQLGDGSTSDRSVPTLVAGGHRFRSVAAGSFHSCGVTYPDNLVYCWGDNAFGKLGEGTTTERHVPTATLLGLRFHRVSAGWDHNCGVTTDDLAYCWGRNREGQVGDGSSINRRQRPVPVAGGRAFRQVDAGLDYTCGVTTDGQAFCWGDGTWGQLGAGGTGSSRAPQAVAGGLHFDRISAGSFHVCAETRENRAYCWGHNVFGSVGDGTDTQRARPVEVAGGRAFGQVSAGSFFTCGVATSDRAFCWGDNSNGQLGDGTRETRSVPAPVAGAT